jgi:hypothetical protein
MTDNQSLNLRRRTVLRLAALGAIPGLSLGASASHRQGVFPLNADTTDRGDATVIPRGSGDYYINAGGHDVWTDADEYGAVFREHVIGDVTIRTTVQSQEDTHGWAKAGLMMADDMTAGGSSPGDILVAVTPDNGFIMDWDGNDDGYISIHNEAGSSSYPCELRLEITDGEVTGSYSTDGGTTWATIATNSIDDPYQSRDVGLFTTSHDRGTRSAVEFRSSSVEAQSIPDTGTDLPNVDVTDAGNAQFNGSDGDYTIGAAGEGVYRNADEYAAVYEDDIDTFQRELVAETRVESQAATTGTAKAGLMAADDITVSGSGSTGDVIVAATPGEGLVMRWDGSGGGETPENAGDGALTDKVSDGTVSYPCRLRLTTETFPTAGSATTGEYSTDDGDTWTELDTVETNLGSADVGVFVTSSEPEVRSVAEFSEFGVTREVLWSTVDTTGSGDARFDSLTGANDGYAIEAAGRDVWTDADEYGAIYEPNLSGDIAAETVIESQEDTHDWAKAGVMLANDITDAGSSAGDIIVAATPANGFIMDWDGDGDGYISTHNEDGSVSYPCHLRLRRVNGEYTGEYSTDGGSSWTTIATTTIDAAADTQDAGIFATSHDEGTRGAVEYDWFDFGTPSDSGTDLPTIDLTDAGDAVFSGNDGDYTIEAAGEGVNQNTDQYAAVYETDNDASERYVTAAVTVESQDAADEGAQAGLMAAGDITAGTSSTGDVTLAATPGEGFVMQWDENGDGYVTERVSEGSVSYPCQLRLRVRGASVSATSFRGEYSTDGGETWTEIQDVGVDYAPDAPDLGVFVTSEEADTRSTAEFSGFEVQESTLLPTTDTTDAGNAVFEGIHGDYTIEAAGHDVWTDADEYGAVYRQDEEGSFVIETTVESQEDTHDWAKAGLMIANDMTAGGSSTGDVLVGVTPENGFIMDWDGNGDGYMSEHREDGSATYPCRLRLENAGGEYVGSYSTDGGDSWTTLGAAVPNGTVNEQDAGVFATSHVEGTRGTVEFTDFSFEALRDTELLSVDVTDSGDATFDIGSDSYTIEAAGHDVWTDADEYGALYEPDQSGDIVAETTIESQEDTHDWAKTGLMMANDITDAGSSPGDVIVAATPANGFIMDWDEDGDGYISTHNEDGSVSYPCHLRLRRSDGEYTGEYSTDGGRNWTTLASTTIDDADDTQDVGIFAMSHDEDTRSTVAFSEFLVY